MRIRLSQLRRIIKEEVSRTLAETRTAAEEARFQEIQAALLKPPAGMMSAADVRARDKEIEAQWNKMTPEERAEMNARLADDDDIMNAGAGVSDDVDDMEVEPGFGGDDPYGTYKQPFGRKGPLVDIGSKYR